MIIVLDSDEENEDRLINVNRSNMQRERIVEVSNVNNEENGNFNSGRGIRDSPSRLNKKIFQRTSMISKIYR